ncbi:MAG: penicillin acylase family protein [Gammaproteobacteria bacterium]|nr:penicillin acylase family protein [Gammaproteobacteria bacterium]
MRRWFGRLLIAVVVVLALATGVAWWKLRASLPELDGEQLIAGLADAASIERDATGYVTVSANNRPDLSFATGYAHGQDRFFQMDLIRRRAAGELSEVFGEIAVNADRRLRWHRFRHRAQVAVAGLPRNERRLLEHYAAGVNAGRKSLAAKPFEYYLLRVDPQDWLPEDSVLVVYAMFLQLNDPLARKDVRRGLVSRVLPADVYAWLYPAGTSWDAPLMGSARAARALPTAAQFSLRDTYLEFVPAGEEAVRPIPGSNNWAVSGALTETGRALVSNDMHLNLATPNIYYRARLRAKGDQGNADLDVAGVMLPGSPFIVAGSNGKIAWAYTNSYGDWSDAVLLQPGAAPGFYRTPVGDRQPQEHRELIRVKDADSVELIVRETVWGPIVENSDYPDGEIAVSWVAHHSNAINLRLIDLETVASVEAALRAANSMGIPTQNFVCGDSNGNIGWTIAGQIPRRGDYDSMLPADWSEQSGWTGWLAPNDYPRLVNPDSHRIWTANARVADGEALGLIGDGGYDLGARAQQIRDGLFARDRFTPRDMLGIQVDDRAIFLGRWQQLLLGVLDESALDGDTSLIEYRRLVQDWMPRAATSSVGYRLVRAYRLQVASMVFEGLMAPVRQAYPAGVELRRSNQFEGPLWALVSERPRHLLPANYESWQELLVDAAKRSANYFSNNFEGPLSERTWGEKNTASIRHPLSDALPWFADALDMPRTPLDGDANLPRAQGVDFGASQRFSVSPGDEENGILHMPAGQSGHPLSEFYRAGHDDWLAARPTPFWPGETRHKLLLRPAGS